MNRLVPLFSVSFLSTALMWISSLGTATARADDTGRPEKDSAPAATQAAVRLDPVAYFTMLQEARRQVEEKNLTMAVELYTELTDQYPDDGAVFLELGNLAMRTKDYEKAILCLRRSIELGGGRLDRTAFILAGAYGATGDTEEAFRWLETALSNRLDNLFVVRINANFKEMRDDERFADLIHLPPEGELSRDEKWRVDVDYLEAETRRMHRNLFHTMSPSEFEDALIALRERISELTDEQILVEMQKIIAMIGDGHSGVRLSAKEIEVGRIPLRLYLFSDGIYVVDATEPYEQFIGSRVMQVGSFSPDEALRATEAIVSRDNPMGWKASGPVYLRMPAVLASLGVSDDLERVPLVLKDREGAEHTVEIETGPSNFARRLTPSPLDDAGDAPLHLKDNNNSFWFEYLPEDRTLYVQYNSVRNKREESVEQFAGRLREFWTENDVQTVVLDVRHNGGGNSFLNTPLIKALVHFETTRNDPRLFTIIGRATFSACQNLITDLDRLTETVFVGEPSGSAPNNYGESTTVRLPFSNVQASISSIQWQHGWPMDHRIWIAPEVPAELSSADYFANRDPAVKAILTIVRGE